jgi:hypothetical protein
MFQINLKNLVTIQNTSNYFVLVMAMLLFKRLFKTEIKSTNIFFIFCLIILSISLNAQTKKAFFPLKMNSSTSEFFSKSAKVDTTQVSIAISYGSYIPEHYLSTDEQTKWAIFKNKKLLKKVLVKRLIILYF